MRILLTGNMGYVGPIVVRHLRSRFPEAELIGLDMGYFAHCLTTADVLPECRVHQQYFADVRHLPDRLFEGVTAVVHLAAVSNDPMGNLFERATSQINGASSQTLARLAKQAGARAFVLASSCSIYGAASDGLRTEDDPVDPLTAYARSKVHAEQQLCELADERFRVTCLRFATACGMSDRLRLDLVLNDFVACAVSSGQIDLLSDGQALRPLIHVQDMARAMGWAVSRTRDCGGDCLTVNVGRHDMNFRIRDLATAVADLLPEVNVTIGESAPADDRSYQVGFERFAQLAPQDTPQYGLEATIRELADGLRAIGFSDPDFRSSSLMRLNVLKSLVQRGQLDNELYWTTNNGK